MVILDGISDTPETEATSWTPLIEQKILNLNGLSSITLTEWATGNSAKPSVAKGSIIEVDEAIVVFDDEEDIDISSAPAGLLYVVVDGATGDASVTPDAPLWDTLKKGFYDAVGRRYTGHRFEYDGGTSFTSKHTFLLSNHDDGTTTLLDADGKLQLPDLAIDITGTHGTWSIDTGGFIIPRGIFNVTVSESNSDVATSLQIANDSGSWAGLIEKYGGMQGLIFSDGEHYRFITATGSSTVHYRRIITI